MQKREAKILIVDDDDKNRLLFKVILRKEGYQTIEAKNGKEGIDKILEEQPDVVLMDIMMPVMDGFTATEILKNDERTKHIPVIILTALSEREEKLKGIEKGANDFLTKPVDAQELLLRIRNHIQIKNYHDFLKNYNETLEKKVRERTEQLRKAFEEIDSAYKDTIQRLSNLAEFRDPETGEHIKRVSLYCKFIAEKLGMDKKFVEYIFYASTMHDIGKVGVPDNILLKQGKLTSEEWEIMKKHTLYGYNVLKNSKSEILNMAADIALNHHEKWDGTGYPYGKKGEEIPISARIMALADVYDALRSDRPYKKGFTHEETKKIILEGDGRTNPSHFDPKVLKVFEEYHEEFKRIFDENC
ncbi:MAG: two-component system response regulator [Hydrogenothermus sp.]|nr:MAG: two-component system response regulator [Hydrogenothermus sp.]